jgi:hypothetical protein
MVLVALLGAFILEGGAVLGLLGFSAFLITFFVPFFGSLAVWSFREWRQAWGHAFRPAEGPEAQRSAALWQFSELACYAAGVLGALIGAVLILGNLEGASIQQLAHAFGALLVSPTYGTLFGLICRILRARVENLSRK